MKSRASWLAILLLVLQPLLWLWPCVFGDRTFVPYDTAEYPPASIALTQEQQTATKTGTNHDVTEVPVWFLPELRVVRDELREGRLPTWDPHARGGTPMHAHGLLGLCYPPNWLAITADDPGSRLGWLAWISLTIGGLLAFGLLRHAELSLVAAWFGATLFQLGTPMAANGFFWMRLASLVWLPGVLWSMQVLAEGQRMRARPLAAFAITFAMPWLAGFPPFASTTAVIAGCMWLRLVAERLGRDGSRAARQLAVRLTLGCLLGGLLAMPQVLPSLLFFPESARTIDPSLANIQLSRFDTYGLLGYLLPDVFGHPTAADVLPYGKSPLCLWLCDRLDEHGRGALPNYNHTEYSVFFGTFGLLLAGYGIVRGRGHRRWFLILLLILLAGLALMVPGFHLLYLLPVIKNVWPMRWLVPAALPLAWLAAIGLEKLWQVEQRSLLRLAAITLALAAIVPFVASRPAAWHAADPNWPAHSIATRVGHPLEVVVGYVQDGAPKDLDRFAAAGERAAAAGYEAGLWLLAFGGLLGAFACWERRPAWRTWSLHTAMALTVAQLALQGQPLLRGCELDHPTKTPVHEFLRQQALAAAPHGGFMIARGSKNVALPAQLPPGQLMAPGIRDLNFYTHFDGRSIEPLRQMLGGAFAKEHTAKGYLTSSIPETRPLPQEVVEPGDPVPFAHPFEHPLLDLLGVRYVLATQPLTHAGTLVGPEWKGPGGQFFVYERKSALPRAFVVPELRVLADDTAVLAALADPTFAPRDFAFAIAADLPSAPAKSAGPPRDVQFVADHATEIVLEVPAGAPGWLVLTDTFLPGWRATIDDREAPIVRGNHSQRLVAVPAQACRVRFTYTSPGLTLGLLLAGIATLSLLLWSLRTYRAPSATAPSRPTGT
jgi:hypothetical protein